MSRPKTSHPSSKNFYEYNPCLPELFECLPHTLGFPSGSDGKESACSAGDSGSIPGSGSAAVEGNGYLLQYYCLENLMTEEH